MRDNLIHAALLAILVALFALGLIVKPPAAHCMDCAPSDCRDSFDCPAGCECFDGLCGG